MDLYFATYGSEPFQRALYRIEQQARDMGFTDTFCYTMSDLDTEWKQRHVQFMNDNPRGQGYYIWKAQVVHQALKRIPENSVLLYADCGCMLNKEGVHRLSEYVDMVRSHPSGMLCFELGPEHTEARWTKMDVLKAFRFTSPEQMGGSQLVGGIFMMVNNPKNRHFVDVWKTVMETNYRMITDHPSSEKNHPSFTEHRHDQSVWSIIRKMSNCLSIPDETWWTDWDANKKFPIHARRNRD